MEDRRSLRRECPVCKQFVRALYDGRIAMHFRVTDGGKAMCPGSRTHQLVDP